VAALPPACLLLRGICVKYRGHTPRMLYVRCCVECTQDSPARCAILHDNRLRHHGHRASLRGCASPLQAAIHSSYASCSHAGGSGAVTVRLVLVARASGYRAWGPVARRTSVSRGTSSSSSPYAVNQPRLRDSGRPRPCDTRLMPGCLPVGCSPAGVVSAGRSSAHRTAASVGA
jgi:hypothetical protein